MGRVGGYIVAVTSVALAVGILELLGPTANAATAAQVLLLVLLIDGRVCGTGPAVVASTLAAIGFARYFLRPTGLSLDPGDWAALFSFIVMAVVVGELASRAERRAAEAQASRQEIARLYQELQAAFDRASEAEAARRNEQLKATLLDALTHNLRTPLTAIKASVTAMLGAESWSETSLSIESHHELLEVIDQESDRLNRFIEGLSGTNATEPMPINVRAVDLHSIVRSSLARAETVTRDHRIELDLDPALPPVAVDAASIGEVLYILLDNASKYAPAGTTITISTTQKDDRFVLLAVRDEGPGIPAELHEKVFEKFFRVPGQRSHDPRRGGIGLGLPIARRLVETQGGRIVIADRSFAAGTIVHITLPIAADLAARAPAPAPAPAPEAVKTPVSTGIAS